MISNSVETRLRAAEIKYKKSPAVNIMFDHKRSEEF
jgi:hypothetical protein